MQEASLRRLFLLAKSMGQGAWGFELRERSMGQRDEENRYVLHEKVNSGVKKFIVNGGSVLVYSFSIPRRSVVPMQSYHVNSSAADFVRLKIEFSSPPHPFSLIAIGIFIIEYRIRIWIPSTL